MRFFIFLFLFAGISFSFKSDIVISSQLIISSDQVGPIKMGFTTIEEARDSLGIKIPVENNEAEGVSRIGKHCMKGTFYQYSLKDSSLGISINAECESLHVVYEIRLNAPCKWKTAAGFGIGSSFEDIKAKMGMPDWEIDTTDHGDHGYSAWHDMMYGNLEFYSFHKMNEPGGCCVDLIIIRCNKILRPNAGTDFKPIRKAKCPPPCTKC
jgi:hypothetical protein